MLQHDRFPYFSCSELFAKPISNRPFLPFTFPPNHVFLEKRRKEENSLKLKVHGETRLTHAEPSVLSAQFCQMPSGIKNLFFRIFGLFYQINRRFVCAELTSGSKNSKELIIHPKSEWPMDLLKTHHKVKSSFVSSRKLSVFKFN